MHFSHNLRAELRGYYDLLVYKLSSITAAAAATTTTTTTTTTTGVSQQNHCETSTSMQAAGSGWRPPKATSQQLGRLKHSRQ